MVEGSTRCFILTFEGVKVASIQVLLILVPGTANTSMIHVYSKMSHTQQHTLYILFYVQILKSTSPSMIYLYNV